jgi:hypothetical protein
MNRITFSKGGEIRPVAVVLVGLVLSAIALALDMLIVNAGPSFFGTPGEVPAFGFGKVLLASVPAVLGNTLGFYLSYRAYHPRALVKFIAPAAGFFVAFMIPPVWGLLVGGTVAAFAVASLLNVVPVAIAVPVLLSLRPNPQSGSAPAASPSNARRLRAETTVK